MSRFRVLLVAVLLMGSLAAPAGALDGDDFTGDIRAPELVSFSALPTTADVTSADASFTFELRITDDLSGVEHVYAGVTNPAGDHSYSPGLTRVSGDQRDGTWRGTLTLSKGSSPGRWPLRVTMSDRVGNGRGYGLMDPPGPGMPEALTLTNSDPDLTAPAVTRVDVPPTVDVRGGRAQVHLEVSTTDGRAGTKWVVVFLRSPVGTAGGVQQQPHMQLVQGTVNAGVWAGDAWLPEHTPRGRWRFEVRTFDHVDNSRSYEPDDLAAAGLMSGFDVLSDNDVTAPALESVTAWPLEVNVHDADQTVKVRLRATDRPSGIKDNFGLPAVRAYLDDVVTQQISWADRIERVSGDIHDGIYELDIVVRRSSATGVRPLGVSLTDAVDNWRSYGSDEVVVRGGPPAVLVYNVPLPPDLLDVVAGDASALVRWAPPADDRGADVTGYVVVESPGGRVIEAAADARAVLVTGLANGVEHTFSVKAINKAGPSDPSRAAQAVPRAGAGTPSDGSGGGAGSSGGSSGGGAGSGAGSGAGTTPEVGVAVPLPPAPASSGYWMLGAAGNVYPFGSAGSAVSITPSRPGTATDIEPTPSRLGYWVAEATGRVHTTGDAGFFGDRPALIAGETITSLSATRTGLGYWLFTSRGRVFGYGDAPFLGDLRGLTLNGPVLDSMPTPSGRGYFMVGSDGGVFSFGDARFAGSTGRMRLNQPVQSLVPDPDGNGYWLVAADGGIFAFDAPFYGSMGGTKLARPITGMVGSRTGRGYLMVAEDGGIFAFGELPFHGSLGGTRLPAPVVAVAAF